jgi:KaiC/GvpD/RAD55 family RecA-like ATPase
LGIERGEQAEAQAKLDAEIAFNTTQQSSESLFLSAVQTRKTFFNKIRTVFRNANIGYQRLVASSIKGIRTYHKLGEEKMIENEMHLLKRRFGFEGEKLRKIAEQEVKRKYWGNWGQTG